MRQRLTIVALVGGAALIPAVALALAAPAPPGPFPPGAAHDTMIRVCSGCHDPAIAAQQRLSPDGWKDLINQMVSRGATATDAELDQITDYLAATFPATLPAAKP